MVDLSKIEKKWQKKWALSQLGEVEPNQKPKFFMIFAYPGVSGYLHVGHMRGFSYTDAICRYKRMRGFNVLFPVGTHASGNLAIAFANKIKRKDPTWMEYLTSNGCPEKLIPRLGETRKVIDFFNKVYVEEYWKKFGFLCDWRRFTCTSYLDYEKFIQWQFKKLRDLDLLTQKPYFATFCPEDGPVAVDPSETDLSKGGNAEKQEYTLLKFPMGDLILVAATLRPETVFGQTNLWVNPKASYVVAQVGSEQWVMSEEGAQKFAYQKDGVIVKAKIAARDLIGKSAVAPMINKPVPIFPSAFVDPKIGSGIVTSVPSHAPFDYVALRTIQSDERMHKEFGLNTGEVKKISPIALIKIPNYSEHPGKEICEKMKIQSIDQEDLLEQAKKEIYRLEFHTGIMGAVCGKFAGMKVSQAKELVKEEMIKNNQADIMHDLSEEVLCRCGRPVVIKRIDDQWFIKYSDNAITKKSIEHAKSMNIYPTGYKQNLPAILQWFVDRACTRLGNWVGSKFPFDKKWVIEPISDSTLYPAYYLISKYVNDKQINVEDLTEEFFDFVFLNKGDPAQLAEKLHREKDLLIQIRNDVQYWYPLDINLGGKEHQTVHFPVFIMNHVALMPEKMWPKGIFVNYWVIGKGSKISKSKGGAEPIPGAVEVYSVDGMRLFYAHIGSSDADIVWDGEVVKNYRQVVERTILTTKELLAGREQKNPHLDQWLKSQMNHHIHEASEALDKMDIRVAANTIYFSIYDDIRWYQRRGGNNKGLLREIISEWTRMLCPITPHIAEEIWSGLKHKELVSTASWPSHDEKTTSLAAQANERMIKTVVDDVRIVKDLAKIEQPKEITIIVAEDWKYPLYSELKKLLEVTRNIGEIFKKIMVDEKNKEHAKDVTVIVNSSLKDPSKIPLVVTDQKSEYSSLHSAIPFLEKELGAKVHLYRAEDSREEKAKSARPGKPAIVVR